MFMQFIHVIGEELLVIEPSFCKDVFVTILAAIE